MALFLSKELAQQKRAHLNYAVAQLRSEEATDDAKMNIRLLAASPAVLLGWFGFGAYKGAVKEHPPAQRRDALLRFARIAMFNVIS
ncbi:hypothetical protein [Alteromonas halophila]|nr:hypothetical protein [Alteromonas halophila]